MELLFYISILPLMTEKQPTTVMYRAVLIGNWTGFSQSQRPWL